jgi:hypothetical protein
MALSSGAEYLASLDDLAPLMELASELAKLSAPEL